MREESFNFDLMKTQSSREKSNMGKMSEVIDVLSEPKSDSSLLKNIRKENKIIHSILDSLSEGVIVADNSGRFLYFNRPARKILGIGSRNVEMAQWSSLYGCYYPDTTTPYTSDELPLTRAIRGEEVVDEILFIRNAPAEYTSAFQPAR